MKRIIVLLLVASVTSALGVILASDVKAAHLEKSPFIGEWTAVDPSDGGVWEMKIAGGQGPLFQVKVTDERPHLAICPDGGPLTAIGKGILRDAFTLDVFFRIRCRVGHYRPELPGTFWYDPEGDILASGGLTFTRS